MPRQVTERWFQESLHESNKCMKIQVNTHAHTPTPADYFVQCERWDVMVECKQIKDVFDVLRVTQELRMLDWQDSFPRNKSYLFIVWFRKTKINSVAYLIPLDKWLEFRRKYDKRTIRLQKFHEHFSEYLNKFSVNFNKNW